MDYYVRRIVVFQIQLKRQKCHVFNEPDYEINFALIHIKVML